VGNDTLTNVVADSSPVASASGDFSMQSAILFGLSNTPQSVTQQLQFSCPSGNCTWDTVQSLAVCSKCEDVSSQLRSSFEPSSAGGLVDTIRSSNAVAVFADFPNNFTKLALPNGLYIDNYNNLTAELQMTAWSTSKPEETVRFQTLKELLWSTSTIRVTGSGLWPNASIEATECALYYCVNEYTPKIVNGFVGEEVSETSAKRSPHSWVPLIKEFGYEPPVNLSSLSPNDSLLFNSAMSTVPRTDLMIGDGFNVTQTGVDSINSYLQSILIVNISKALGAGESFLWNMSVNGYAADFTKYQFPMQYKPDAMQVLSQSPNLTETFSSIATSMSNAIRAGADQNQSFSLTGRNGATITYYSIQWPWISLPVGLLVAGYLVLFLGSYQARKGRVPVWKSGALPVMATGRYVQDQMVGIFSAAAMRRKAKTLSVCLSDGSLEHTDHDDAGYVSNSSHSVAKVARISQSERSNEEFLLQNLEREER
jgi:hypothetical protein